MKGKEPEQPLFRVFRVEDNQLAYLPSESHPNGLPREEAERLSANLAAETYVKQVWTPNESGDNDE